MHPQIRSHNKKKQQQQIKLQTNQQTLENSPVFNEKSGCTG